MNFKKLTPVVQQLTAAIAISALVLSLVFGAFPTAFANHDSFAGVAQTSLAICHGPTHEAVTENVGNNGISNGHETGGGMHALDIIPPYHYLDNHDNLQSSLGRNWSGDNITIYNNGACNGVVPPDVELTITKELVGSTDREVGDPIVFNIKIENIGTDDATDVIVTDSLATGLEYFVSAPITPEDTEADPLTWEVGPLGAGEDMVIALTVTIGVSLAGTQFNNTATVDSAETDPVNDTSETIEVGESGSGTQYGTLEVIKVVSGSEVDKSSFSFSVSDIEGTTAFESDGSNRRTVEVGTYSVTETSAEGFITTYGNSLNSNTNCTGLTVSNGATTTCTITNTATTTGGGGGGENATTLTVIKKVINGPVATSIDNDPADFSLTVVHGTGTATSTVVGNASGTSIEVLSGNYTVSETSYVGYSSTSLSVGCSGEIAEGANKICTVTNEQDRYHIEGTVWNDEDEDGIIDEGEDVHSGWTVHARHGEDDITAVTGENGVYTLDVPRGTWVVSPEYPSGWEGVPGDTSHTYTLPDDIEYTMGTTHENLFAKLWNAFIPTAHAALMGTIGGVNFGTKVAQGNGGGNGGGGGGGNGVNISLSANNNDNDNDNDAPAGEVLGEATSILPAYAPNTGAGGATTSPLASLFAILGMIMSLVTLRSTRIG